MNKTFNFQAIKEAIKDAFGEVRSKLFEVEFRELVTKGCDEQLLNEFLLKNCIPVGAFVLLSAIRRSKMSLTDFLESHKFLFTRHEIVSEIVSKDIPLRSKVLEVGFGRGLNLCTLALGKYEVYGVDISKEYLNIAELLLEKLNCRVNLRLVKGSELPFDNNYFDAVLYVWTLHEMKLNDIEVSIKESFRVLKHGGLLYVVDQEGVAPFEQIKRIAEKVGYKLVCEEKLSPVYDHGKSTNAIVVKYQKSEL